MEEDYYEEDMEEEEEYFDISSKDTVNELEKDDETIHSYIG